MPSKIDPRRSGRSGGLRWPLVWNVAWRDLLSTLRDRRTLVSTILLPLLILPLFTLGMPLLLGRLIGGQATERQKVGVVGTLPAELRRSLTRDESGRAGVELVSVTDPVEAVQSGEVEAALRAVTPLPTRAGTLRQARQSQGTDRRSGQGGKQRPGVQPRPDAQPP